MEWIRANGGYPDMLGSDLWNQHPCCSAHNWRFKVAGFTVSFWISGCLVGTISLCIPKSQIYAFFSNCKMDCNYFSTYSVPRAFEIHPHIRQGNSNTMSDMSCAPQRHAVRYWTQGSQQTPPWWSRQDPDPLSLPSNAVKSGKFHFQIRSWSLYLGIILLIVCRSFNAWALGQPYFELIYRF